MNWQVNNSGGGGIGLTGVLFVVFLVLKLTGVIDWSWWWVISPLWISAGIFVLIFLIILCVYILKRRKK